MPRPVRSVMYFSNTIVTFVMAVTLVIWIGLFLYLRRVEAKVEQLEKRQ